MPKTRSREQKKKKVKLLTANNIKEQNKNENRKRKKNCLRTTNLYTWIQSDFIFFPSLFLVEGGTVNAVKKMLHTN